MANYSRRGLHGRVVDELGMRIMRGALAPGQTIDPDALLHEFDVSRTVLREALKVLSAKGLVDARPRFGTFVTERSRWQLLDNDVMQWRSRDDPDPVLVLELGEVRQVIEPAAARMAAVRRTPEQLAAIERALDAMRASAEGAHGSLIEADLTFHSSVLSAAGNELLERFEVVLEPALHARDSLAFRQIESSSFLAQHSDVLDAIRNRDSDAAFATMKRLMDSAAEDTASILRAQGAQATLAPRPPAL